MMIYSLLILVGLQMMIDYSDVNQKNIKLASYVKMCA